MERIVNWLIVTSLKLMCLAMAAAWLLEHLNEVLDVNIVKLF